eukprot:6273298-Ditylum_brightwellii.AAC.2
MEEDVMDFILPDGCDQKISPTKVEQEECIIAGLALQAELLRWHYCLGHLSFHKLKLLSAFGILSQRLANVKPPKCTGCIYGSMAKRPWCTKGNQMNI